MSHPARQRSSRRRGAPCRDQYRRPAAKTAREFLSNALTYDRFSPGDLAGVVLLVRAPCPDDEARPRLAYHVLRPLSDHPKRLDVDQLIFAARLSTELGATLAWSQQDDHDTANLLPDVSAQDLLLYFP